MRRDEKWGFALAFLSAVMICVMLAFGFNNLECRLKHDTTSTYCQLNEWLHGR